MELHFNTIMFGKHFINIETLNKGLTPTDRPILFPIELSKERALEDWIEEHIMNGCNRMYLNNWIDNFEKCKFTKITIKY